MYSQSTCLSILFHPCNCWQYIVRLLLGIGFFFYCYYLSAPHVLRLYFLIIVVKTFITKLNSVNYSTNCAARHCRCQWNNTIIMLHWALRLFFCVKMVLTKQYLKYCLRINNYILAKTPFCIEDWKTVSIIITMNGLPI